MNPLDDPLAGPVPDPTQSHLGSATPRVGRGPEPAPQFRWGETQPIFAPGAVVSGRYRILRFIAKGGMGEVYEAEDLELRERVALKTVRPEVAQDEGTVARFKREIHLARRVTHPNVCRIFDLGVHHAGLEDVLFLTMELLEGETLSQRFKREGRMHEPEAQQLVRQIAEALDAAHRAGVIHRDLKSANVMLVPSEAGVRAVVTDFGLARSSVAEEGSGSLTGSAMFVGTPAYLAPEQLEGKKATAAADLYSLGVMMYEMLTGVRPFSNDTPMAALTRRLREPPAPPHKHVPTLDARWEARILRCLERAPENRFPSAAALVRDLDAAAQPQLPGPPRAGRWLVPAAAAGLILLAGTAVYLFDRRPAEPVPEQQARAPATAVAAAKNRRSVAVLGFKNLSGRPESNWLSTALSEMLSTELVAGEQMRIIPQESVARMKADLALAEAESFSKETLGRIGAHLGAELVVVGSYLALGGEGGPIRLDLRLQDTVAGETLDASAETGTEAQLLALVSRMGARLRQALGVPVLRPDELAQVEAVLAAQPESTRLYAEGVRKLQLFDAAGAREVLEQAIAADPNNPLAHAALAEAWSELGERAKAVAEAELAFKLSEGLLRQERFWVEGRYHELAGRWEQAIEIYRTLFSYFKDNLDYGLRLAAAQTAAGKSEEALSILKELRALPAPARDDPRIDLAEAQAEEALRNPGNQLVAARRAAGKAQALGSRLLAAEAKILVWKALLQQNDLPAAKLVLNEARQLYAAAGDRQGLLRALSDLPGVLSAERTVVLPRDGTHVPLADGIMAFFATNVDLKTLGPEVLRLTAAGADAVCGTADDAELPGGVLEVSAEVRAAFLTLPAPLPAGQRYCGRLGTGVKDLSGQPVPEAGAWSFFVYDASGFPGSALDFDGNDFVILPDLTNGVPEGTIELWFNADTWNPGGAGLYVWAGVHRDPRVSCCADGINLGCHPQYLSDKQLLFGIFTQDWAWAASGVVPTPGTWYHLAGTWGAAGLKIYVDGVLKGTSPFTGPAPTYTRLNLIGSGTWPESGFDGQIDEVRLWSVARTEQQLQESMHRPLTGSEPGLVGYWSFADAGGITTSDFTPNSHHGVLGAEAAGRRPVWVPSGAPVQAGGRP